jgi:hypothetical protein
MLLVDLSIAVKDFDSPIYRGNDDKGPMTTATCIGQKTSYIGRKIALVIP